MYIQICLRNFLMKKRNIFISVITQVIVGLALMVVATILVVILYKTGPKPPKSSDSTPLRRVEVMRAVEVPVQRQFNGFGTAAAMDSAEISAEVSALVTEIPNRIVEGAEVAKDEILAVLEKGDFLNQVQIFTQRISEVDALIQQLLVQEKSLIKRTEFAAKETQLANTEFDRVLDAFNRNGANEREVNRAEEALKVKQRLEAVVTEQLASIAPRRLQLAAQHLVFESEKAVALRNVQRCTVRSPLKGFIQSFDLEEGERVSLGDHIGRIVNVNRIEVPLQLPSSARGSISVGDKAILFAQGASKQQWEGSVHRIAPEDNPLTRAMSVYIEVQQSPNDTLLLPPGKFVQGTVISSKISNRYIVPRRALIGDRLLIIEDDIVTSRHVKVDFHVQGDFPTLNVVAEQWAVLSEPLPNGSLIVVNAARSLPDGLRVEPISLAGDGKSATALLNQRGDRK